MQMRKHKRTRIQLKEAAFIMAFLLSFNSCFFYVSSYAASSTDLVYENDYSVDDGLKDDGSVSENEALIDDTVSENMLTDSKKAAAYDEDSDIEIAIDDLTDEDYPADNEDLFAAYFDSLVKESLQDKETSDEELNNESRIMSIGDPDRALYDSLNEYERPIYDALSSKIKDIASGKAVDTQFDISLAQVGTDKEADAFLPQISWSFEELGASGKQEAASFVFDRYINIKKIHEVLLYNSPYELYWYDKVTGTSYAYGSKKTEEPELSLTRIIIRMAVSKDFCNGKKDPSRNIYYTADPDKTGAATNAVEEAEAVVAMHENETDHEKLVSYKDYILDAVSYNNAAVGNDEDYGNPWQLIWVFDKDPSTDVVCEGYSKAFKYLCDLSDFSSENIRALLMGGYMLGTYNGGGHMWNIVRMDDMNCYMVDLTNSDSGMIGSDGSLFLAGYEAYEEDTRYSSKNVKYSDHCYKFICRNNTAIRYYGFASLDEKYIGEYGLLSDTAYNRRLLDAKVIGEYTFTGREIIPQIEVTGIDGILTEGIDYEYTCENNILAGDKDDENAPRVIITAKAPYKGTLIRTFTIKPIDNAINENGILPQDMPEDGIVPDGIWVGGLDKEYVYTASPIKPLIRVYDNTRRLDAGRDYTISYINNSNAGNAGIKITGKGNYHDHRIFDFKITPKDISSEAFRADNVSAVVKNDRYLKPQTGLYWNNKRLVNNRDFAVVYLKKTTDGISDDELTQVSEPGEYILRMIGKGNYTGTRDVSLKLVEKKKPVSGLTIGKIAPLQYTGEPVEPVLSVKDAKKRLIPGEDYKVTYHDNVKAGKAYAVLEGLNGYTGFKRVEFTIRGTAISKAKVEGLPEKVTYDAGALRLVENVRIYVDDSRSGISKQLTEGVDYELSCINDSNAGRATVTVTGLNGYTGTVKKSVRIIPYQVQENDDAVSCTLISDEVVYVKNGAKPKTLITYKDTSGVTHLLKQDKDYTLSYRHNKAVNDGSKPSVMPETVIRFKGNFKGTIKKNFRIKPALLSQTYANASDKAFSSSANAFKTKVTLRDGGMLLEAGKDYSEDYVYSYKNDTTVVNNGRLVLRPAGTGIYGDLKKDIIPADTVLEIQINAKEKSNYVGSVRATYRITQKSLSDAKVKIKNKVYTGSEIELTSEDITVRLGRDILTEGVDYEIVEGSYVNNLKKGTARVRIRGMGDYGSEKTVTFKIVTKSVR